MRDFRFPDHRIGVLEGYDLSIYEPSKVVALAYAINQKLGNNYECRIIYPGYFTDDHEWCDLDHGERKVMLDLHATRSF